MPVNESDCLHCKMPKTRHGEDGSIIFMKCYCDYQRELLARRNRTIDRSYWNLNMGHWNPKIYQESNGCEFQTYIKAQKILAIYHLWEFAFKNKSEDKEVVYELQNSVKSSLNLFIRGPANSGRGLIAASIKMLAAIKGISATPLPCEFSVFKSEMQESEAQSKGGDEARITTSERYLSPQLLVLENLRSESQFGFKGEKQARKVRSAGAIDSLLAKRLSNTGSMILTSYDFIGEIGETLGDMMMDMMISDRTTIIILLSAKEADAVLNTLITRLSFMRETAASFGIDKKPEERKMTQERYAEKMSLETLNEALYFEESFPYLNDKKAKKAISVHSQFEYDSIGFDPAAIAVWVKFKTDKETKSLAYEQSKKMAMMNAIRACKELPTMTDKEYLYIAKIASRAALAMKDPNIMVDLERKSQKWLSDMGATS